MAKLTLSTVHLFEVENLGSKPNGLCNLIGVMAFWLSVTMIFVAWLLGKNKSQMILTKDLTQSLLL